MKKKHYFLILILALLVSNCDTNDDGFYNNVFVESSNIVYLDPHTTNYTVNEKIYVNANFSRYQNENGSSLDIFKTTGASEFAFSYLIEKQVSPTVWDIVTVNDNQLDIVSGNAQNGPYVYAICEYNTTNENYSYRVGFPLLSPGTYRLSYGYNSSSTNSVELRSLSPTKRLVLNINSIVSGLDGGGYYNFIVN